MMDMRSFCLIQPFKLLKQIEQDYLNRNQDEAALRRLKRGKRIIYQETEAGNKLSGLQNVEKISI